MPPGEFIAVTTIPHNMLHVIVLDAVVRYADRMHGSQVF